MPIVSVNFHLLKPCNYRCRFCFATFGDIRGRLSTDDAARLVEQLAGAGCEKLNFAGGEPTLHPDLGSLLGTARRAGMTTSIVTNGWGLEPLLERHSEVLDWAGLSVDSSDEDVLVRLGRGSGGHAARSLQLAELARRHGVRLKLNTVVTAINWREDMSDYVGRFAPERWKVFQVLPIEGQNDGAVDDLLVSPSQLRAFVRRHAHLDAEGLAPIVEDNDAMTASYVMVDPLGRFFSNAGGRHTYSDPILAVGVEVALAQVTFDHERLMRRGGIYAWTRQRWRLEQVANEDTHPCAM